MGRDFIVLVPVHLLREILCDWNGFLEKPDGFKASFDVIVSSDMHCGAMAFSCCCGRCFGAVAEKRLLWGLVDFGDFTLERGRPMRAGCLSIIAEDKFSSSYGRR